MKLKSDYRLHYRLSFSTLNYNRALLRYQRIFWQGDLPGTVHYVGDSTSPDYGKSTVALSRRVLGTGLLVISSLRTKKKRFTRRYLPLRLRTSLKLVTFFYFSGLLRYTATYTRLVSDVSGFVNSLFLKDSRHFQLALNYPRTGLFPIVRDWDRVCFASFSLGIMSWRFGKGKCFTKTKPVFLSLAAVLRKILLYAGAKSYFLVLKKSPRYLIETLNTLLRPVVNVYKHPFGKFSIDERTVKNSFYFNTVLFTNNKAYGFMKGKKKHSLKRKISRVLFIKNRVSDIR